uniref:Conotoxin Cl6a n=1 Tax=Californiconus californicus TaxID=1736779 RepID=U6A_CONCL|nr:RecName: Full=Conotoxin Cl6a; AltName: Full=Cal6.43a [Californiconus californicus]
DDCTTYCYGVHCCPPAFKCAASGCVRNN